MEFASYLLRLNCERRYRNYLEHGLATTPSMNYAQSVKCFLALPCVSTSINQTYS